MKLVTIMDFNFFSPEKWPFLSLILFYVGGRAITFWHFLLLIIVLWLISVSPSPFRQMSAILLFLLILTIIGIFSFPGLAAIMTVSIVIGLLFRFVGGYWD